jgi:hypothetical protein
MIPALSIPALVRLLDMAAKRFGHDLMPEADADHLRLAGFADELLKRRDPRQRIVDAGGRAGDEIGVVLRRIGQLACGDVKALDLEPVPKQTLEHRRIVAELVGEIARRVAGFEDR